MPNEPMTAGNMAEWVSAGATIMGLGFTAFALFKRQWDERALQFDSEYKAHGVHRTKFWKVLRAEWGEFRREFPDVPERLFFVLRQAGLPPPPRVLDRLRDRSDLPVLTPSQQTLWRFVKQIYPRRPEAEQVTAHLRSMESGEDFHITRGELTWFWGSQPRGVRLKHFRKQYRSERDILIALAWLNVALAHAVGSEYSSDELLFKTAQRAWNGWSRFDRHIPVGSSDSDSGGV